MIILFAYFVLQSCVFYLICNKTTSFKISNSSMFLIEYNTFL